MNRLYGVSIGNNLKISNKLISIFTYFTQQQKKNL